MNYLRVPTAHLLEYWKPFSAAFLYRAPRCRRCWQFSDANIRLVESIAAVVSLCPFALQLDLRFSYLWWSLRKTVLTVTIFFTLYLNVQLNIGFVFYMDIFRRVCFCSRYILNVFKCKNKSGDGLSTVISKRIIRLFNLHLIELI